MTAVRITVITIKASVSSGRRGGAERRCCHGRRDRRGGSTSPPAVRIGELVADISFHHPKDGHLNHNRPIVLHLKRA